MRAWRFWNALMVLSMTGVLVGLVGSSAGAAAVRHVSTVGSDTGDCVASPCRTIGYAITQSISGDTISIAAGTYAEHVVVDRSLVLRGASASSTFVDGSGTGTAMTIGSSSTTIKVSVSGITIQHGQSLAGGGLASVPGPGVSNQVALTNLILSNNVATVSPGTAFGGGIYNAAGSTLTVFQSTVMGNSVVGGGGGGGGLGGGIYNAGSLTLARSTVSGNSATGGIGSFGSLFGGFGGIGSGGGVYDTGKASSSLVNSTIAGNSATGGHGGGSFYRGGQGGPGRGGGIESGGAETLLNTTVTANVTHGGLGGCGRQGCGAAGTTTGGGADVSGSITLTNAILAGNHAANGPDCYGTATSGGHNLLGFNSSCAGFTNSGDLVNVDPLLGPLQNNGGPTFTMALGAGSPAIDAADDTVCGGALVRAVDQRGYPRPGGAHCDIGAFEVQP